jgi:hypothetical protein
MSSKGAERRRHPRRSVSEAVLLKRTGSEPVDIHAHLLDISEGGFRASHDCANLRPGDEVMFHSPLAEGAGRVVWTMICGNRIESGFLILDHDERR